MTSGDETDLDSNEAVKERLRDFRKKRRALKLDVSIPILIHHGNIELFFMLEVSGYYLFVIIWHIFSFALVLSQAPFSFQPPFFFLVSTPVKSSSVGLYDGTSFPTRRESYL